MKRVVPLLFVVPSFGRRPSRLAPSRAQQPSLQDQTLQRLVEAERQFAHAATQKGIRDSFLEPFAPDAIALTPGAAVGGRAAARLAVAAVLGSRAHVGSARLRRGAERRERSAGSPTVDARRSEGAAGLEPRQLLVRGAGRAAAVDSVWYIDVGIPVPGPVAFAPGLLTVRVADRMWARRMGHYDRSVERRSRVTTASWHSDWRAHQSVIAPAGHAAAPQNAMPRHRDAIVGWGSRGHPSPKAVSIDGGRDVALRAILGCQPRHVDGRRAKLRMSASGAATVRGDGG